MTAEITVARQLAALRRKGFGTLEAIGLVAPALDPGHARGACERAAERLRTGAGPGGEGQLEAMLSRGDAASPAALDCLAQGYEAAAAAAGERRRAVQLVGAFVIGPLLLASLAGWAGVGDYYLSLEGGLLPAPTRGLLRMLGLLKWTGPVLALAVALGLRASLRERPGRGLRDASRMLQLSGALEAGQPEDEALALLRPGAAALDSSEARFLHWARGSIGLAAGARVLAGEKLAAALERQRRFERLVPPLLYFLLGLLAGVVFLALYMPGFTLASSLRP